MSEHSPIPGKTPDQARRAQQATAKQAIRDGRTAEEQLGVLETRPGGSERERARLERSIEEEDTADNVAATPEGGDTLPPRKRTRKRSENKNEES